MRARPVLSRTSTMSAAEERPLLHDHEHEDAGAVEVVQEQKRTPLPIRQLVIVYLIQASEPLTGMVIYPFIAQLVFETGVTHGNEKSIGYYAGAFASPPHSQNSLTSFLTGIVVRVLKIGDRRRAE